MGKFSVKDFFIMMG